MSDNNLVPFPGPKSQPAVNPVEEQLKKAQRDLILANQKRKGGIEKLRERVNSLMQNENINAGHMSPATVEVLRDLLFGLNAVMSALEGHDTLIDMLAHDLIGIVQNLDQMQKGLFQTSAFTQTLITLLKEKGVVNDEDMKEVWDRLVAQANQPPVTQG